MDSRQKLKRMVNELMDMQTDAMYVYIHVYRDDVDAEFFSPEVGIGVARKLEWDSFYPTVEAMVEELDRVVSIHRKLKENR